MFIELGSLYLVQFHPDVIEINHVLQILKFEMLYRNSRFKRQIVLETCLNFKMR